MADPGQSNEPQCEPCEKGEGGPPREGGGTTGAGNLSPGMANRTGGATSGVEGEEQAKADFERARKLTPDP